AVYNVIGREVAVLTNEIRTAGNHEITFDASLLPSGIYFYRLEAGDFTAIKKMVLMK
ncbi:T9SS type A sorting domain-containing protein, partial [bacterium]|nr:T9SS type A sorting domain-containing protein [bacterium]